MDLTTKKQIFLKKGELIELASHAVIVVGSGAVWLTFEGVEQDYILKTGDRLECNAPKPVIEALEATYIVICEQPSRFSLFGLLDVWSEQGLR
jgi:quercetin dioxygenase-like cupin family protein